MPQTIAFYNLENFFDTVDDPDKNDDDFLPNGTNHWTENRYLRKLEKIAESIASIQANKLPVIIGVAEIENKTVLTDLLYQAQFERKYDFVHFDSPDKRGIDVALLYNKDCFELIDAENLPVHFNGDSHYSTRDILYVKGKLYGNEVHFFVNHWHSRGEGILKSAPKRIAAAKCLHTKAMTIFNTNPNAKMVIMGDFNDLPISKSIVSILNAKTNKNITNREFYNLAFIPYNNKKGTLFAQKHWLLFDQIIISKGMMNGDGLKIKSQEQSIHHDKNLLYYDQHNGIYKPNRTYAGHTYHGGSSDHLPVYVAIDIEN
jgi:predicted extracellular nuclease